MTNEVLKILESLANPKISFGFAVVFHVEKLGLLQFLKS
jgi:hypothetical protein